MTKLLSVRNPDVPEIEPSYPPFRTTKSEYHDLYIGNQSFDIEWSGSTPNVAKLGQDLLDLVMSELEDLLRENYESEYEDSSDFVFDPTCVSSISFEDNQQVCVSVEIPMTTQEIATARTRYERDKVAFEAKQRKNQAAKQARAEKKRTEDLQALKKLAELYPDHARAIANG